ncbi:MAG: TolB family protein [Janthinobacterium lividum]
MPEPRVLAPGQRCQVWIGGPELSTPDLVFETDDLLLEAPNWTVDGQHLVLNGAGGLWLLDTTTPGSAPERIQFASLPDLNNDHVLSPDGRHVYMSAMDGHIYRGTLTGGAVELVSPDDGYWHFLHGVSPDGQRLAYVEISTFDAPGKLIILGPDGQLSAIDVGPGHLDGPEWSPDGAWIYLNTETFTTAPGHAQLARVPDGGGNVERLTHSSTVDWFPHLSPDGRLATYISFPAGTLGHPADLDVEVKMVSTDDWATVMGSYPLSGGQGTLNVNSWAPDSSRFAFVAYPLR